MSKEIKWIKITTDIFDDEKIKLIDSMPEKDTILVIWLKLLTLAGKSNRSGYLLFSDNIPYDEEMLSTLFNRPINSIRLAIGTFKKFRMITVEHFSEDSEKEIFYISNWEKHQNIDGMEKIREQNRIRFNNYYKRKKEEVKEIENKGVTDKLNNNSNVRTNVSLTQSNATEVDKEVDKDIDIDKDKEVLNNKNNIGFKSSSSSSSRKGVIGGKQEATTTTTVRSAHGFAATDKKNIFFNPEKNVFENITDLDLEMFRNAYPLVDISKSISQMTAWLVSTNNQKKYKNWKAFINKWLSRAQISAESRTAGLAAKNIKTFAEIRNEKNMQTYEELMKKYAAEENKKQVSED